MTLQRLLAVLLIAFAVSAAPSSWRQARAQASAQTEAAPRILVMVRLPATRQRSGDSFGGAYGDASSQVARRRIVQALARRHGMELVEGWPMPLLGVDCFVLTAPTGVPQDVAIAQLEQDTVVLWAQPLQTYQTRGGPTGRGDPLYAVQPAASAWRLADLHRYATGRGVSVAVIDSQVDIRHPDLSGQFGAAENFVGNRQAPAESHGTGVAGIIGAKAGNGLGIAGVAPDARILALRACWETPGRQASCDTLTLAKALHFAIENGVEVINLSLSGPPDKLLDDLIGVALDRRISVVAAYDAHLPKGGFPASRPGVVAVADDSLRPMPPAVYGAPGHDIPTTQAGGTWYVVDGSSYAVAHVSGLIALVRQRSRGAAPLLVAASGIGNAVDACATLLRKANACSIPNLSPRAGR